MGLKECLLNELKQKEDGSSASTDYDEELYMSMKEFWDLFSAGRSTITLTCTSCGNILSTTDDEFDALLLCFPASHHEADEDCTLEQLIAHYNATELIPNCDCNICNQKTTLSKQIAITTCPPILCVVLCRKKLDGGSITSSVQFPVSGLNITGHELQYDLVGTIHHVQRGIDWFHYTSICKTQHSRNWFKYDNESVSVSRFVDIKQNNKVLKPHTKTATMLFYVSTEPNNQ